MYEPVQYRMAGDGNGGVSCWHCSLRAKCKMKFWRRKKCVSGLILLLVAEAGGTTVHGDFGLPESLLFGCRVVKGATTLLLIKLWVNVLYM